MTIEFYDASTFSRRRFVSKSFIANSNMRLCIESSPLDLDERHARVYVGASNMCDRILSEVLKLFVVLLQLVESHKRKSAFKNDFNASWPLWRGLTIFLFLFVSILSISWCISLIFHSFHRIFLFWTAIFVKMYIFKPVFLCIYIIIAVLNMNIYVLFLYKLVFLFIQNEINAKIFQYLYKSQDKMKFVQTK